MAMGRKEPTQPTHGKTDKDQMPGRTSLPNLRGEAPRQTTRQTARGSWGWSLLQVDTEIQRGEGRAVGSVLRILWREGRERGGYCLPDGGGPGLTAEELRWARPRANSPPATTLPILQDDGSRDARLFHEDGVRAPLGATHPPGWGPGLSRADGPARGGRDGYPGPRPIAASRVSSGVWRFWHRLGSLWRRRRRRLRGSSSWGRGPPGAPRWQETEAAAGAGSSGTPGRAAHGGDGALGGRPAGAAGGRVGTQMRP